MKIILAQRFRKTYNNLYTIYKDENNKVIEINSNPLRQLKFGDKVGVIKGETVKLTWEYID